MEKGVSYVPNWQWPGSECDGSYCLWCYFNVVKALNFKRHIQRRHKDSLAIADSRKSFLIKKFEHERERQKGLMVKALTPDEAVPVASYKLTFTIAKYKMPFSKCDALVEFA